MATVKDAVCGAECDESQATRVTYDGKTYHVCSNTCRDNFIRDPERYARSTQSKRTAAAALFFQKED